MPELPGRDEQIIQSIIDGTEYTRVPQSRIEYLLLQLKQVIESGGGGTSDILTPISESAYNALATKDKPLYFIYED